LAVCARLDICTVRANFSNAMNHPPSAAGFRSSAARVHRRRSRDGAFTMMELLVVLAILGLLAGLAISNVSGIFGGAQVSTAQIFVKESMKAPLFTYSLHMGGFPSTAEGLPALIAPPGEKSDRWHGPYITESKVPSIRGASPTNTPSPAPTINRATTSGRRAPTSRAEPTTTSATGRLRRQALRRNSPLRRMRELLRAASVPRCLTPDGLAAAAPSRCSSCCLRWRSSRCWAAC
jgi:type II secretion system protein G